MTQQDVPFNSWLKLKGQSAMLAALLSKLISEIDEFPIIIDDFALDLEDGNLTSLPEEIRGAAANLRMLVQDTKDKLNELGKEK